MKQHRLERLRAPLLATGILASLLYTTMLVVVPIWWESYSSASQTVSELSAIDAPTRTLWVALGILWGVVYAAFGWEVWQSGQGNRALRVAGALIIGQVLVGTLWPPMHQREVLAAGGKTLTDTLHVVWTVMNGLLTLLLIGFAAAAIKGVFRVYSIVTIVILLAAGMVTSLDAPRVDANLSTPWVGIWERINIGVWLLWIVVLSIALLRRRPPSFQSNETQRGQADTAAALARPGPI